uniref:T9SS type A sorting domain-containing protein n=1 Tax=candidate division WOR-3 bacterium TaxID=2052148 RepID=A0A7V0Z509_UNCW3
MKSNFILCFLLPILFLSAQSYLCDWQVVSSGGLTMTGNIWCGSTTGQTAIGWTSGMNQLAHIGFWYPEGVTGIEEEEQFKGINSKVRETKLFPPAPNPFYRAIKICYSLNAEVHMAIQVYDIMGRKIRVIANSIQKPGEYSIYWDGRDDAGRNVSSGVYILRFIAGDCRRNAKIVLTR